MDKTKWILDEISDSLSKSLKEGIIDLPAKDADGRVNSQKAEQVLVKTLRLFANSNESFIKDGLHIEETKARHWYDFSVKSKKDEDIFLPVNLKVSNLNNADNLSSKEGCTLL